MQAPLSMKSQEIIPDNLGKDFWLVFPPNFHNERINSDASTSSYRDSLYILITVSRPTNVYIERMNRNGAIIIDTVFISQINTVKSFSYPWFQYELIGFNDSGRRGSSLRQDEVISQQYFHITAEEDIGVYAFNNARTTTDATLVLPIDALSNAYRVAAYNSHRPNNDISNTHRTPSQFVVLSVLDSTYVTISPSVRTMRGKSETFSIMLNRGESYLIQSDVSTNLFSDISGTNILSSKKIAVFSGHQRALVPYSLESISSRDHLFEQLPGIAFWGKSAVVIPFNNDSVPRYRNRLDSEKDVYRVFAHYDSTEIYVDGQFIRRIESGQFYEAPLLKASLITSNKAIMAMAYKSTSGQDYGDPFMALMPPTIQFLTRYTFLCPSITGTSINDNDIATVYSIHYLNLVVPDKGLDSVFLDNTLLPKSTFTSIPNSGFSYGIMKINAGVHTLRCSEAIGGFTYGYGNAISYGYGLGLRFKKIDNNEPVISGKRTCYEYAAQIFDTLFADSYIDKFFAPDSSNTNIVITDVYGLNSQKGGFKASLRNPYLDGFCVVIAEDSIQQQARKRIAIPGFTVSVQNNKENTFTTLKKTLRTNRRLCFPVTIENYGKYTQTITSLTLKNSNSGFSISENLPIILNPNDKKVLTVCFYNAKDTLWNDTLFVSNDCIQRPIQAFSFKAITDRSMPQALVNADDCLRNWDITLTEIKEYDIGISDISIPDSSLVNCTAIIKTVDSSLSTVSITVIDDLQDAEFTIIAEDSSGNTNTIKKAIPGYTISFTGKGLENTALWNFGSVPIGTIRCDSVMLYNYGKYIIDLQSFALKDNVNYSIPPSQFPLIIPPGDSVPFIICYEPKRVQSVTDNDGVALAYRCNNKNLEITGNAVKATSLQAVQCEIPLRISSIGDKLPTIQQIYPQPINDAMTIDIESFSQSRIIFTIIDGMGVPICSYNPIECAKGYYTISLPVNNLVSGLYYLQLSNGGVTETKPITIVK